ncbi:MAG TPA: GNAT family N-acetyltransferase [Pyrinomonadaceae bacterium]|nr:GNAT family N-acetyltransferase [Pyrinomonadaceae bacterium]
MAVTLMRQDLTATLSEVAEPDKSCTIRELNRGDETEVLDFLAARPIHTVFLSSLIRDNGLLSPHNRGSFYACRGRFDQLEGVALLGHATMIEAYTESSLASLARLARNCQNAHLIRGERKTINRFWKHYANPEQEPRLICRELLFEQREAPPLTEPVEDLRPATLDDLDQILKVNSAMAFQEAGVSPLNQDPGGFRQRTARRIEQGRVWIWVRDGKLMFKADVVAETPEAVYLEGVHVHPEERLKGYGSRYLSQLGSILLTRSKSICLTLNQENKKAMAFYARAGYKFHSHYETIYLR